MKLALSGGGFRAALFQLGILRYLRETDRLKEIDEIYSVSGGSILAGHLVKNWKDYAHGDLAAFERCATDLVGFMMKDIRTKIVCAWLFSLVLRIGVMCVAITQVFYWGGISQATLLSVAVFIVLAVIFWKLFPRRTLIDLLQAEYERLYTKSSLTSVSRNNEPHLFVMTTDLTTGNPAYFDSFGITLDITESKPIFIPHNSIPLSMAVAASSAFPPLFSPVQIDKELLNCDSGVLQVARYLCDGGVYDNLGLEIIKILNKSASNDAEIISCNAERLFDDEIEQQYGFVVSRSIRSNDIMMAYMSSAREGMHKNVRSIHLKQDYVGADSNGFLAAELQRVARNIRTDLDDFNKGEVQLLFYKGYGAARAIFENRVDVIPGFSLSTSNGFPLNATHPKWLPCSIAENDPQATIKSINCGAESSYLKFNRYTTGLAAAFMLSICLSYPVFSWLHTLWSMKQIQPSDIKFKHTLAVDYLPTGFGWIRGEYGRVAKTGCGAYVVASEALGNYTHGMGHTGFTVAVSDKKNDAFEIREVFGYLVDVRGAGIPLDINKKSEGWTLVVPNGENTDKIIILLGICEIGDAQFISDYYPYTTSIGSLE